MISCQAVASIPPHPREAGGAGVTPGCHHGHIFPLLLVGIQALLGEAGGEGGEGSSGMALPQPLWSC